MLFFNLEQNSRTDFGGKKQLLEVFVVFTNSESDSEHEDKINNCIIKNRLKYKLVQLQFIVT